MFQWNKIGSRGEDAISDSYQLILTIENLGINFQNLCNEVLIFAMNTHHHLESIMELLIDKDKSQMLAIEYRIRIHQQ
jgi:hypothetical protein